MEFNSCVFFLSSVEIHLFSVWHDRFLNSSKLRSQQLLLERQQGSLSKFAEYLAVLPRFFDFKQKNHLRYTKTIFQLVLGTCRAFWYKISTHIERKWCFLRSVVPKWPSNPIHSMIACTLGIDSIDVPFFHWCALFLGQRGHAVMCLSWDWCTLGRLQSSCSCSFK